MKIKYPRPDANRTKVDRTARQKLVYILLLVIVFIAGVLFAQIGDIGLFTQSESGIIDTLLEEINTETLLYRDSALPTLYLDIPFNSMLSMIDKREEALALGILFSGDEDMVPATIRMDDDQNLDIDIRLKGDWSDHLETNKWSFRIHIKEDGGTILGMQRFSLQAPYTRNYVHEWSFHQNLIQEGILTTRYDFINVVINGEHKGVYALEESFTEDLLESQERREGVILRYDESLLWADWANTGPVEFEEDGFWLTNSRTVNELTPYRGNHISRNETLTDEFKNAADMLYALEENTAAASAILDEELWGRYYAIADLWGASHSIPWNNIRLYYNPITGLLEPVVFDGMALRKGFLFYNIYYPYQEGDAFLSPGIAKAYVETLERITTPAYFDQLEYSLDSQINIFGQALLQEYMNRDKPDQIFSPWSLLRERGYWLAKSINPAQPIRGNYHITDDRVLHVDLVNMMILHVELQQVRWGDEILSLDQLRCSGTNCDVGLATVQDAWVLAPLTKGDNATIVDFQIPLSAFSSPHTTDEALVFYVNLYGGSKTFEVPIGTNYVPQGITQGILPTATLEEALATHDFLLELGDQQLGTTQGEWDVNTDLILPEGYSLNIPYGTTLRFGAGTSFIVRGRVDMFGTEDAPITITSQNGAWGGMLILNAESTSTWEYVRVSDTHRLPYPGMGITGGITFYQSDVDIRFSQIGNNQTEDALNVIQSDFTFEQVEFLNAPSDAFDGDFVQGAVTNCSFHDIAGDGVDISGSTVTVKNSYFVRLGDKALSAGEHSIVTAENLTIRDVGIGVASKDLSEVTLNTTTIENAQVAGLAAYIKKPQYGAASITAADVTITDSPKPTFCQTENEIILNGENILAEDFDVDALYEQGILGN